MVIGTFLLIISLIKLNGLNAPTKRHRLAGWFFFWFVCFLSIYAVYKRYISDILTESEGMKKDIPCKWKSKES